MKNMKALSRASVVTFLVITILVIWAEMSEVFKNTLAKLAGHHWTAKSLIALVVFFLTYLIFSYGKNDDKKIAREIYLVVFASILCALVIFGFFLWHYFSA